MYVINQTNYIANLRNSIKENPANFESVQLQEWKGERAPEIVHTYETTSKVKRIAGILFSTIIFPIGLAQLFYGLVGKLIFSGWIKRPKSQREFFIIKALMGKAETRPKGWFDDESNYFLAENRQHLVAKRINVLVDGQKVDGFIYGRRDTIDNGVWTLVSKGAGDCMEHIEEYQPKENDTNYLFFNYTGVGGSNGLPSKKLVVNAYKAMLQFLENKEKGIGAKKITCWGRSIGAAVQGEALQNHPFQNHIKYHLVKDRPFSRLSEVGWYTKILRVFGWEFDCVASSEKLEKDGVQEIILQTTKKETPSLIKNDIHEDGLLSCSNTLAYALLTKQSEWKHKKFIGISKSFGHYRLPPLQHAGLQNHLVS